MKGTARLEDREPGRVPARFLNVVLLLIALGLGATGAQDESAANVVARIQIAPDNNVRIGIPVALDASGSTSDVPADLVDEVRYTWSLGDTATTVGERIAHTYDAAGTYRVSLTMDVFESTGIYHRATATAIVNVLPDEVLHQVVTLSLDGGFAAHTASSSYALTWPWPQITATAADVVVAPAEDSPGAGARPAGPLHGFVFSGGVLTLGEVTLWNASIGLDLLNGAAFLLAGYGRNTDEAVVSLTDRFSVVDEAGGELLARIGSVNHYSLGGGYRVGPPVYVVADLGCLVARGVYTGSSRVTIDGQLLPVRFREVTASLAVGIGLRIGALVLSAKLLFAI